jgi:hypothetical protein
MYRVFVQGTEEEPVVYDDMTYVELIKDVPSLEGVRDILDRLNIRKRIKREFYMGLRKVKIHVQAGTELYQVEAEDSSWAIMYWKI